MWKFLQKLFRPAPRPVLKVPTYSTDDALALARDWKAVGKDLQEAMDQIQHCSRAEGHDGPCNGWPCQTAQARIKAQQKNK